MIYKIFPPLLFLFLALNTNALKAYKTSSLKTKEIANSSMSAVDLKVLTTYESLNANQYQLPDLESFSEALKGFYTLKEKGVIQKNILTLIDFRMSSNAKRLWVINLDTNMVLFQSLVAHGKNTGDEFADSFSNKNSSFQSSLGFYATGEIYNGKHGLSLRLDGLEKGINDNARKRAVVIHGADYVSEEFIKNNKRLGRSLGCPALPPDLTDDIIETIKDKSCLFIYHPSRKFSTSSGFTS